MVNKMRQTQEEEILQMLEREGFIELTEKELQKEPYKSIYALPDCFDSDKESQSDNQP